MIPSFNLVVTTAKQPLKPRCIFKEKMPHITGASLKKWHVASRTPHLSRFQNKLTLGWFLAFLKKALGFCTHRS